MLTLEREDPADRPRVLVLATTLSAIVLFVGVGGAALTDSLRALKGLGETDAILSYALLANIAVIVVGWYRYRSLSAELARQIAAKQEARRLADSDPLTGCLNRRSLLPRLATMLADDAGKQLVIFLIDLDGFKQINDRHGHLIGDLVLAKVAERLRSSQPPESCIARLGGDEFACAVLLQVPCRNEANRLARRMIEAVASPIATNEPGLAVDLTLTIGIAATPGVCEALPAGAQTLLNQADIAMYRAKRQGKNRYLWFEAQMEVEQELRRVLERDMRAGLAAGEFVPFYEQQVDLQTGELLGFEMLARWQSAVHGLQQPSTFIPLAEDVGLIAEISETLIAQAFRDAAEWNPRLTLAVNISPVQLRDPWFAQRILKLLVQHNFPPSRLDIEITESCLHEDIDEVRSMILSLRNQGVKVSLDDFGTGYASLNQLRDLTFDHIKIDRSFVSGITDSEADQNIVEAIVSLGAALGLPVTAEGVECENTLRALARHGRLKGQGYHYGKPENADAVRRRLHMLGQLAEARTALRALPEDITKGDNFALAHTRHSGRAAP